MTHRQADGRSSRRFEPMTEKRFHSFSESPFSTSKRPEKPKPTAKAEDSSRKPATKPIVHSAKNGGKTEDEGLATKTNASPSIKKNVSILSREIVVERVDVIERGNEPRGYRLDQWVEQRLVRLTKLFGITVAGKTIDGEIPRRDPGAKGTRETQSRLSDAEQGKEPVMQELSPAGLAAKLLAKLGTDATVITLSESGIDPKDSPRPYVFLPGKFPEKDSRILNMPVAEKEAAEALLQKLRPGFEIRFEIHANGLGIAEMPDAEALAADVRAIAFAETTMTEKADEIPPFIRIRLELDAPLDGKRRIEVRFGIWQPKNRARARARFRKAFEAFVASSPNWFSGVVGFQATFRIELDELAKLSAHERISMPERIAERKLGRLSAKFWEKGKNE